MPNAGADPHVDIPQTSSQEPFAKIVRTRSSHYESRCDAGKSVAAYP